MSISPSKFFTLFLLVLFVICTFLTLKTVNIYYNNDTKSYLTHERTIQDILTSEKYPANPGAILSKPLLEGMVIEITPGQIVRIRE